MKKTLLYAAITATIGLSAFFLGQNAKEPEVITETVTEIVQADPKVICMDVPVPLIVEKKIEVPVEVPVEVSTEKLVYVPQIQTEYIEVPKSTLNLNDPNDINMVCDIFGKIVDWNTDGQELAVMTADGYEFYAYKSADIYQNKNYVPVNSQ